jgi:riboflavin kinase/FMN adenylyltransferase
MLIIETDSPLPPLPQPYGLTIGSFDGMHRGHQALIQHLRTSIGPQGTVAALTFRNHPSALFHPKPFPQITPLAQKLRLMEQSGIDLLFLTDFSPAIAGLPYDQFLLSLKMRFPFTFLSLGQGASFGKDKQGTQENIFQLAKTHHFHVEYIPKLHVDDTPISSFKIRSLIQQGDLKQLPLFLGRPYSLLLPFPTHTQGSYTITAPKLCLLPSHTYPVHLLWAEGNVQATVEIDQPNSRLIVQTPNATLANTEVEIIFEMENHGLETVYENGFCRF